MPIACLCLAGLLAIALDRLVRRPEARRVPPLALAAIVAVVLFADLHVRAFHGSMAHGSNAAYAATKRPAPGRLVEVPVFTPDIHYGSVHLYYAQQVLRERPLGYSTTAPPKADVVARHLEPLNCGDWTTGVADRLRILKVSAITLHRGLFVDNPIVADTAWMAWRGLVANGWRPTATAGAVTAFVRGRSSAAPPFPSRAATTRLLLRLVSPGRNRPPNELVPRDPLGPPCRQPSLFLGSPEPLTVRIAVDGQPRSTHVLRKLLPQEPTRVELAGARWHLVALETDRLPIVRGKPRGARIVGDALP